MFYYANGNIYKKIDGKFYLRDFVAEERVTPIEVEEIVCQRADWLENDKKAGLVRYKNNINIPMNKIKHQVIKEKEMIYFLAVK